MTLDSNEEYIKKLEEENAKLLEKMTQIEKRDIELNEKEEKLDTEYLNFYGDATKKSSMLEMTTRLILQFENETNLDLSDSKDLTSAMKQWNEFNENFKEYRKYKHRTISLEKLEEISSKKKAPNIDDYTEHMYHLDRMIDWRYDNLSEEDKKEYNKCRDYLDGLLDKFLKEDK